jgi:predicted nucleic acid-binding protein
MAKYAELIAKSKDEKERAQQLLAAEEADLQSKKVIFDAKVAVSKAKSALEATKQTAEFDIEDVVIATRALRNAEEDLKDLETIHTELF